MLALVVALTVGQCTKYTDCKGERVCSAGECVEPTGIAPEVSYAEAERHEHLVQLTMDLGRLRDDLSSASIPGPVVSMVAGAAMLTLCVGLGVTFRSHPEDTLALGAIGFGLVGAALFFTGAGVLTHRLELRRRLPGEIAAAEERLRAFGGEP